MKKYLALNLQVEEFRAITKSFSPFEGQIAVIKKSIPI